MVTFVLATYALVTFVHISNISAVTGPILTKLFGPNFFGVIIFVDQNVLGQNFFKTQNFICFHNVSMGSLMSQWCVSLFEWRIKGVLTLVKRTFMGV